MNGFPSAKGLIVDEGTMNVWTVSEEKAGTLTQCLGVANYLDGDPRVLKIGRLPRWRMKFFPPYMMRTDGPPDVVISCGIFAERHVSLIKNRYGGRPLTVHLQPPVEANASAYDMAFVPRHDWQLPTFRGVDYRSMIGVPHRVTSELLSNRRASARRRFAVGDDGQMVVAMLLGGPNGAYDFDRTTIDGLVETARQLASQKWTVLVSTSRRSPSDLLPAFLALSDERVRVWDRTGDNPYLDYLAAADAFLITKDTVTMHCEALMSGRPVYSLDLEPIPGERLAKFEWLHRDFQSELHLTRPYEGSLAAYDYTFENQAERIAAEIRLKLDERRAKGQGR